MEPKFSFVDSSAVAWEKHLGVSGVEIKKLLGANGQVMELYRVLPNIIFPDHLHDAPEFLYLLEDSAKVDG